MEPVLDVRDLAVQFETVEGTLHAVNGVSFRLRRGETLGIVGESGSGKSVSMMSLLRLIPEPPGKIHRGRALFYDAAETVDLLSLSNRRIGFLRGNRIGYIFQDPMSSLNPLLTVGIQIRESIERHTRLSGTQAKQRAIELLELVGIPSAAQRYGNYPHQFSGGMRQRVMIAIAISCDPAILIADEPTTALDVTVQAQILALVRRLTQELGISVIWISHDLGVIASLADRVLVMYGGTVVERGDVEELFTSPRHPYTVGLLGALPKLQGGEEQLVNIRGTPPSLFSSPTQCPFEPRCPWAFARCKTERPPEFFAGTGRVYLGGTESASTTQDTAESPEQEADEPFVAHRAACFHDLDRDQERDPSEPPAPAQGADKAAEAAGIGAPPSARGSASTDPPPAHTDSRQPSRLTGDRTGAEEL